MLMPEALFALIRTFAAQRPVPLGLPGEAHDQACRDWTLALCQQAAFTFPTMGYGAKRAAPDRPLSKDVLACQTIQGLRGWDVLIGAGTGVPAVIGAPTEALDLTGQTFEPVVPHDWLGASPPGPGPEPPTGQVCDECRLVLERMDVLVDTSLRTTAALQHLQQAVQNEAVPEAGWSMRQSASGATTFLC